MAVTPSGSSDSFSNQRFIARLSSWQIFPVACRARPVMMPRSAGATRMAMRGIAGCLVGITLGLVGRSFGAADDESAALVAKQKQTVAANAKAAQISDTAIVESTNLLLC